MTTLRRLRPCGLAACALASGLFAGCANSSQFTAGRMPYGGESSVASAAATQDPFLAQAEAATGRPPAGPQDPRSAPPGLPQTGTPAVATAADQRFQGEFLPSPYQAGAANPYQVAYGRQADRNPFAEFPEVSNEVSHEGFAQTGGDQIAFAPEEENPFAEIEGQPAVGGGAARASAGSPLPQITPAGGAETWQARATTTASYEAEEFLPPMR